MALNLSFCRNLNICFLSNNQKKWWKTITLQDEIKKNLEIIKSTKGVENIVLTQRDGNPIQFSGVWLSKDEIFNVSAATAAIYNCGIALHQNDLKYILIEGKQAKILLSPLKN